MQIGLIDYRNGQALFRGLPVRRVIGGTVIALVLDNEIVLIDTKSDDESTIRIQSNRVVDVCARWVSTYAVLTENKVFGKFDGNEFSINLPTEVRPRSVNLTVNGVAVFNWNGSALYYPTYSVSVKIHELYGINPEAAKLDAIKLVRSAFGLSLREATEVIKQLAEGQKPQITIPSDIYFDVLMLADVEVVASIFNPHPVAYMGG